ncbi:MAG: hypothetical protein K2G70_04075 [Turicibacter sp.]|nr:hypothetical protein [Turicibacter sp.]
MGNKIRLFSAVAIPLCLFTFFMTSYQNYLPSQRVIDVLDHYQSLQYNSEDISMRLLTDSSVETVLINKMLPSMTYKILDTEVTDNEAKISVQISNINLDHVLETYQANLVEQTIQSISDEAVQANSQIDDYEVGLLVNLIDDPSIGKDYITQEVNLTLHKENGVWVLEENEAFFKAVMGYQSDEINFSHLVVEAN